MHSSSNSNNNSMLSTETAPFRNNVSCRKSNDEGEMMSDKSAASDDDIEYEVEDTNDHDAAFSSVKLLQTTASSTPSTPAAMAALALAVTQQDWSELGLVGLSAQEVTATTTATTSVTGESASSAAPRDISGAVERITALLLMRMVALATFRQKGATTQTAAATAGEATTATAGSASAAAASAAIDLSTTNICNTILSQPKRQKRWKKPITALLISQLRNFTRTILERYQHVHYHNWEHAYHVVISAHKLLDVMLSLNQHIHCRTFGLKRDPIAQLALVFAALIHDVEHQGITNRQLVMESDPLAMQYNDTSVLENCSLNVAFVELQSPQYAEVRQFLFPQGGSSTTTTAAADDDYRRFRKIVINLVLTTDIASPERTQLSKSKWKEAFGETLESLERKRSKLLRSSSGNRFFPSTSPRFTSNSSGGGGSIGGGGVKSSSFSPAGNSTATNGSMTPSSMLLWQQQGQQQQQQQQQQPPTPQLSQSTSVESSISPESVFPHHASSLVPRLSVNRQSSWGQSSSNNDNNNNSNHHIHHPLVQPSIVSQMSELTLESSTTISQSYLSAAALQQQQHQQQVDVVPPPPPMPAAAPTADWAAPIATGDDSSHSSSVTPESSCYRGDEGDGGQSHIIQEEGDDDDDDDDSMDGVIQTGTTLSRRQQQQQQQEQQQDDQAQPAQQQQQQRKSSLDQDTIHTKNARQLMGYDSSHQNRFTGTESTTVVNSSSLSTTPVTSSRQQQHYLRYQETLQRHSSSFDHDNRRRSSSSISNSSPVHEEDDDDDDDDSHNKHGTRPGHVVLGGSAPETIPLRGNPSKNRNLLSDSLHGGSLHHNNNKSDKERSVVSPRGEPMVTQRSWRSLARSTSKKFTTRTTSPTNNNRDGSPPREDIIDDSAATDAPNSPRRLSMNDLSRYLRSQQQRTRRAYHGSFDQDDDYDGFAQDGEEEDEHSQTLSETLLRKPAFRECQSTSGVSLGRRRRLGGGSGVSGASGGTGGIGELYDSTDSNEKGEDEDGLPMTAMARRYSSSDLVNGTSRRRVRKRALRLSIRRSMDLGGQTIEHFSSHSRAGSMESQYHHHHHHHSPASNMFGGMCGIQEDINWDPDDEPDELRATVVLELFLKAADVAHNLQGWATMEKWSSQLFLEVKSAYESGRGDDPEPGWYENQIGFLESYLIPMARRLNDTGVFGTQIGPIFEQIVHFNLERWITDGMEVTEAVIRKWQEQKWECQQQQKSVETTLTAYNYFDK